MRIHIAHRNVYRYDPPAAGVIQVLRLTPRNHEGQYVVRWRIDVSADARLAAHEDAFGNITHVFSADGPFDDLTVEIDGEVETQNTDGIMRGTVEPFGPSLFLRDTALTQADTAIRDFVQSVRATKGAETLAQLHGLLDRLHDDMGHDPAAPTVPPEAASPAAPTRDAAAAFARKRGTPRDLSHVFIAAAHALGIPARYVSGYFSRGNGTQTQHAGHAWAEAFVPDLGWIAFDPSSGFCPTEAHVRVAVGLDSLGAAPVRGTRLGQGAETLDIAIKVGQ